MELKLEVVHIDPEKKFKIVVAGWSACRNTIPYTGWLKQQKFTFSQFWRLEVQNQCVDRFFSPSRSTSLWLAVAFFPLCPYMVVPQFVLCPNLLFLQGHRHIGLEITLTIPC